MVKSKDKSNVQYKLTLDQIREIIKHSKYTADDLSDKYVKCFLKNFIGIKLIIIKRHTPWKDFQQR